MTTQPTQSEQIADQTVTIHRYNTIIVGSGAAGMNCAVSLYEQLQQKDITDPTKKSPSSQQASLSAPRE